MHLTLGEPSIVDLYVQFTTVLVTLFCQTLMRFPVFVAENSNTEIVEKVYSSVKLKGICNYVFM